MISTRFIKIAASGLAMGLALTGAHRGDSASAEAPSEAKAIQLAANAAGKATKALADRNGRAAVSAAEAAVEYQPRDPQYRVLLGQAYLTAGRFSSAATAFSDALTLTPDNARAALNLALAEIAQGKRDQARSTLADYADRLSASDFGLASALAGDVDTGIRALESAIRDNGGDVKTRQNLALAYAMAGRWANARVMAGQDLAADQVSDRIGEWAAFVQPQSSFDQVASLLGVTAVPADSGQPVRLALNPAPVGTALAAAVEPVSAPVMPTASARSADVAAPVMDAPAAFEVAAVNAAPVPVPATAPAPLIRAEAAAVKQAVAFAPPAQQVIVPAMPAPIAKPAIAALPKPSMPKPFRTVESGKFVVQLGAFQSAAISRDAWRRMAPRYDLGAFDPANSRVRVRGSTFIRLAVGGFATRADAIGVCTRIRSVGGSCFVRGMINDAPAYWVQRGMPKVKGTKAIQVASR
jgi:Flp pilus assembly protein TadD